ncbi:cell division protein FtsZ, partial [mine drainage metagenome]
VPRMPLDAAFKLADAVLMTGIKGLVEIVTRPGLVNLDYSDILTVMKDGGVALIGLGEERELHRPGDRSRDGGADLAAPGERGALGREGRARADRRRSVDDRLRGGEGGGARRREDIEAGADHLGLLGREQPEMQNTIKVLLIITGV